MRTLENPPPLLKEKYPGQLFRRFRKEPLALLDDLSQTGDDVRRLRILGRSVWVLFEPSLVESLLTGDHRSFEKGRALQRTQILLGQGLLTAEGSSHLKQRRTLQPAFRKQRIEEYAKTMASCSEQVSLSWRQDTPLDAHKEMMTLALSIVSQTLLGTDLVNHQKRIAESLEAILGKFGLLMLPFFEQLQNLPLPIMREFRRRRDDLFAVVDDIVDRHSRRGADEPKNSLIDLMVEVDPGRVKDEVLTMLLAGHETTANALTFSLDLLARNPKQAKGFYAEVRTVLKGRSATAADYAKLPYTRRVLQEVLRLYPPAWIVGRRSLEAVELGPYTVPADTLLLAPQWSVHRDPRRFESPLAFEPDRWLSDDAPKFGFFPFGGGTRICIGEGFARMEAVLVLATLGRDWTFRSLDERPTPLQAGITLRPLNGLPLGVERAAPKTPD